MAEDTDPNIFYFQNGMAMKWHYLEDGISDFILSKHCRMLKEFRHRNEHNQKVISNFIEKYQHFNRKPKQIVTRTQHKMYNIPPPLKDASLD